ncbi:Protein of unknown function [Bacillus mycoides]|nr:Protein of unknown function [Bacillus mycoides]
MRTFNTSFQLHHHT